MPNKPYAKEWLIFAKRNLDTAKLLFKENHYEDIIGIELQQTLEKTLKSLLAYENKKIPKSHKLIEIFSWIEILKLNDDEKLLLELATDYYKTDRYPNPNYSLPSREEIQEVLDFTVLVFQHVLEILEIDDHSLSQRQL